LEGLCARQQAAPHDTLGIGVLAALRATCSPTRLRAHSPVWIPCQPAPFGEHCSHLPLACFRATVTTTDLGRSLQGSVAMSSLRQLDADRPQAHFLRTLLFMRTTRYFLKQSQTIISVPCFLARLQSCVSGRSFNFLNRSAGASRRLMSDSELVRALSSRIPVYTEACSELWNSTKTRLNLHTRHVPPPASF
jgi:hypothetical protein